MRRAEIWLLSASTARVAGTGGLGGRLLRACRILPGAGGWPVAVEHFGLVLVPRAGGPVGVDDQGPAPPVDHDLITIWWWNGHSSTQSVTDVVPPRALCRVWWTWQAPAGWVQPPAHWQCRSRSSTALRIPAGTVPAYPISSGRLGPPRRAPSSRRRRNEASPPGPETRSTALPITACSRAAPAASRVPSRRRASSSTQ